MDAFIYDGILLLDLTIMFNFPVCERTGFVAGWCESRIRQINWIVGLKAHLKMRHKRQWRKGAGT